MCVDQGIHTPWDKLSLHAYGDEFYIHIDSQVGNLEGIAFFPNTRFIIHKAFGNIYFSYMPDAVFAIDSSSCCLY